MDPSLSAHDWKSDPPAPSLPTLRGRRYGIDWLHRLERATLGRLPDHPTINLALSQFKYFLHNRRAAQLHPPLGFAERLMGLKLSEQARSPALSPLVDKAGVKQWVTARLGPGHCVPTLALLDSPAAIADFAFPVPSIAKPTHACRDILFFLQNGPTAAERRDMAAWLEIDFFAVNREPPYRGLTPKVIVEPYIGDAVGPPDDVKLLCFHGRPKIIQVNHDRFGRHSLDLYDMDGRWLPLRYRQNASGRAFPYPALLPAMDEMAKELSRGLPFVRVDLYVTEGRLLVGEMALYPSNCTVHFEPAPADRYIARLFDEPDLPVGPEHLPA